MIKVYYLWIIWIIYIKVTVIWVTVLFPWSAPNPQTWISKSRKRTLSAVSWTPQRSRKTCPRCSSSAFPLYCRRSPKKSSLKSSSSISENRWRLCQIRKESKAKGETHEKDRFHTTLYKDILLIILIQDWQG